MEAEHPLTDELVSVSSKNRRVARTYTCRGALDTALLQGDAERTVHGGEESNRRGLERDAVQTIHEWRNLNELAEIVITFI